MTYRLAELPLELLQRGHYQPREIFDEQALAQLADTIQVHG